MDGTDLIMLQFFGMNSGVTVLIVGTLEFEQQVIISSDDSDLRMTLAVIFQRALHNSDPFFRSRI